MKYYLYTIWLFSYLWGCTQSTSSQTIGAKASLQESPRLDSMWFCSNANPLVEKKWYTTVSGRQKALIIYPEAKNPKPNLIVFLHGDSPFRDPIYQYKIAKYISKATNSTSVAILRPGYKDDCGDLSEGKRGKTMGDNYTAKVVKSTASIISTIQKKQKSSKTIVIGHSGGAALTALLAEEYPELINQALLIACPCNLQEWRKVMRNLTDNPEWLLPMEGLSPIDGVGKLPSDKNIFLFVGKKDVVTPPHLSEEFYQSAGQLEVDVKMKVFEDVDHESILRPDILSIILEEIQ